MRVLRCAQRGSAAALCRCWSASNAGTAPGQHCRLLGWQHRRALRKRCRRSAPLSAATDTQVRQRLVLACLCQVCLGHSGDCQQARRRQSPVHWRCACCRIAVCPVKYASAWAAQQSSRSALLDHRQKHMQREAGLQACPAFIVFELMLACCSVRGLHPPHAAPQEVMFQTIDEGVWDEMYAAKFG